MAPDEFGRDPAVQMMRRVFKGMEAAQERLIAQAGLSRFDERLRSVRVSALAAFEQAWGERAGWGEPFTEGNYVKVYETCFLDSLG